MIVIKKPSELQRKHNAIATLGHKKREPHEKHGVRQQFERHPKVPFLSDGVNADAFNSTRRYTL